MDQNSIHKAQFRAPNSPHLSCPSCNRWFLSISAFKKHVRTIHRHAGTTSTDSGQAEPFNDGLPLPSPTRSMRLGPHQDLSPISSPHFCPQPSSPALSHSERLSNVEGDLSYLSSPRHPHSSGLLDNNALDHVSTSNSPPNSPFTQIYLPFDQPYNQPGSLNDPYEPPASPIDLYDPFNPPFDPPGSLPLPNQPRERSAQATQPAHSNHNHTTDAPSINKIYHPIINGA
jgi:hypothetical protein